MQDPTVTSLKSNDLTESSAIHSHPLPDESQDKFIPDSDLPDELAVRILEFLSLSDLPIVSRVSKKWNSLSGSLQIYKQLFYLYTQGMLWTYLVKEPSLSSYELYFKEVFDEPALTIETFNASLASATNVFIAGKPLHDSPQRLEIRKAFIEQLALTSKQINLSDVLESYKTLSAKLTTNLSSDPKTIHSVNIQDIKIILPVLKNIHELDILFTQLIYLKKFGNSEVHPDYCWLFKAKWNRFLSAPTIMAVEAFVVPPVVEEIILEPKYAYLLERLSEEDLIQAAQIDGSSLVARSFARHPILVNRISDEGIIKILSANLGPKAVEDVFSLLLKKPDFLQRLTAVFIVELAEKINYLAHHIMVNSILISLLDEAQCIRVLKKIELPDHIHYVLNQEAFWQCNANINNLLFSFGTVYLVIAHNRAAAFIDIKRLVTLTQSHPITGKAIANQPILLDRLNSSELVLVAQSFHQIAIALLQNTALETKWGFQELGDIDQCYCYNRTEHIEIRRLTQAIRHQLIKIQPLPITFSNITIAPIINDYPKPTEDHLSNPFVPRRRTLRGGKSNSLAYKTNPNTNSSAFSSTSSTLNRSSLPLHTPTITSRSVDYAKWLKIGLYSLLGLGGLALVVFGIGTLVGAPAVISLVAAINILAFGKTALGLTFLTGGIGALLYPAWPTLKAKWQSYTQPGSQPTIHSLPPPSRQKNSSYTNLSNTLDTWQEPAPSPVLSTSLPEIPIYSDLFQNHRRGFNPKVADNAYQPHSLAQSR